MKKNILNFKLLIIALVISLVAVFLFFLTPRLPEGSINIENLANYDKHLPVKKKNRVSQDLFRAVKLNMKEGAKLPKGGAFIREETFKSRYDKKDKRTTVSFIVDIPALRQSYFVQYYWLKDENDVKSPREYPELTTCLLKPKDAIYKEFKCKDLFSHSESPYDSMMNLLPYSAFEDGSKSEDDIDNRVVYNALYRVDDKKNPYIQLIMNTCDKPELIKKYTEDFHKWLKFHDVKSEDLNIKIENICI